MNHRCVRGREEGRAGAVGRWRRKGTCGTHTVRCDIHTRHAQDTQEATHETRKQVHVCGGEQRLNSYW